MSPGFVLAQVLSDYAEDYRPESGTLATEPLAAMRHSLIVISHCSVARRIVSP